MNKTHKELVNEFLDLLHTVSDEGKDVFRMIDFLNMVLRYKQSIPPTTEMITVLKHHKPVLFRRLKQMLTKTSPIYSILELQMDYEMALDRLGITEDQINLE